MTVIEQSYLCVLYVKPSCNSYFKNVYINFSIQNCHVASSNYLSPVVETLPYTEIAPHLSSSSAVPTLPPINIPSQQSVDAYGISHQQTLEREDIKFPDINQGTSLSGMRIQPSTESFKERIKSGKDKSLRNNYKL